MIVCENVEDCRVSSFACANLSSTSRDMPEIVAIRAATLDDPSRFAPTFVTYADRAQEWDRVDPALTAFAEMPPGPQ